MDEQAVKFSIMRTALLTAYPRTFSNIPCARSIFKATIELADDLGFSLDASHFSNGIAIEIEARYKAIERVLQRYRDYRILELGAGLSPRGLRYIDAGCEFFELDLPEIIDLKQRVYEKLGVVKRPQMLKCDLRVESELEEALNFVDDVDAPLVVVSEGLFWYLSWEEKISMAKVINKKLASCGGVWVTSDCPPLLGLQSTSHRLESKNLIGNSVAIDVAANKFRDAAQFVDFFAQFGFNVELYWLDALTGPLASAATLSVRESEVRTRLDSYAALAVMTSKTIGLRNAA